MKVTYLAVFTEADPDERGFTVTFPDVPGAVTEGDRMKECVENAEDVLGTMLCLNAVDNFPEPSTIEQIHLENNQLVKPVTVDIERFKRMLADIDNNPIRYAREQTGMNIKELAEYLGAPYRTVQDWNAGNSRPPRWMERILFDHIMRAK